MKFAEVKREMLKTDWYFQAAAGKRLYLSYPWFSCSSFRIFGKKIPVCYQVHATLHDNFMDDYISKESLKKGALYYFGKQKKNPDFINQLMEFWHQEFLAVFLKINAQTFFDEDFSKLSNDDLVKKFKEYSLKYLNVWQEAIFLDSFDYYGQQILNDALNKESIKISDQDLDVLLTPPQPSFLQQERLDVLKVAESQKDIIKQSEQLSNKYYWLHNDFATVDFLKPGHFRKKVEELQKSTGKLKAEQHMRESLRKLKREKLKIAQKYHLSSNFINVCNFLAILGNFRDERKTYNQMASSTLRKFAQEFSARTNLPVERIEQLNYIELLAIFEKKKHFEKLIAKRLQKPGFYYITGPMLFEEFLTLEVLKLDAALKMSVKNEKLKGMPAYNGVVQGNVKIVKDKRDFHKMKKGDILVAPNTRPEFVPIMKIAGAIVTEEGGITCHAAIVSRELKIPCVVGVQGITSVLKDGDKIIVDAVAGSINKI